MNGSYDPDLNLIYWGVGNPNPDYYGDSRPGDNLYSNSLVALNADTGELQWHYNQNINPHEDNQPKLTVGDIDYDGQAEIILGRGVGNRQAHPHKGQQRPGRAQAQVAPGQGHTVHAACPEADCDRSSAIRPSTIWT